MNRPFSGAVRFALTVQDIFFQFRNEVLYKLFLDYTVTSKISVLDPEPFCIGSWESSHRSPGSRLRADKLRYILQPFFFIWSTYILSNAKFEDNRSCATAGIREIPKLMSGYECLFHDEIGWKLCRGFAFRLSEQFEGP